MPKHNAPQYELPGGQPFNLHSEHAGDGWAESARRESEREAKLRAKQNAELAQYKFEFSEARV